MITSNAKRYPISAQCKLLGVPRATYYALKDKINNPKPEDPMTKDVIRVFKESRKLYGTRKIKAALKSQGKTISRRRIAKIMKKHQLKSTYRKAKYRLHKPKVNEAEVPNILERNFNGYKPQTHLVSDLTYVRVKDTWCYVCLIVDLYNREIVGHAAAKNKNADLVKAALATLDFSLEKIEVFHTDRGSEFDNSKLNEVFDTFSIKQSLSAKGCPYDNAIIESTNKILKAELIYREKFKTLYELQLKLSDYVHWYNHKRMHSTLGYLIPVEFRRQGKTL